MSVIEVILELSALVLLSAYLYARHRQRAREQLARDLDESQWAGSAMDVTILRPRLQRVRADYNAHTRPHDAVYRAGLLGLARQALGRLAFFQEQTEGPGSKDSLASQSAERA